MTNNPAFCDYNKLRTLYIERVAKNGHIENANMALAVIFDVATKKFLMVNGAWTKLLGWTQQEIIDLGIPELVHPDDQLKTQKIIEDLTHDIITFDFSNRYKSKNGTYIRLIWNAVYDTDSNRITAIAKPLIDYVKKN